MDKIKVLLISILYIPASAIGNIIGTFPKYFVVYFFENRFIKNIVGTPDWYPYFHFYDYIEPFVVGIAGGIVSGFVINEFTKQNKSLFLVIFLPIVFTAFILYAQYFANNFQLLSKSDDWISLTISIVSFLVYFYLVLISIIGKTSNKENL